jgi:membrane protease YdiL (CAAX protease family)
MPDYVLFQSPFPWTQGVRRTYGIAFLALLLLCAFIVISRHTQATLASGNSLLAIPAFGLAIAVLWRQRAHESGISFSQAIGFNLRHLGKKSLRLYWLAAGVIACLIGMGLVIWIRFELELPDRLISHVVGILLLAPLFEEIFFRGMVLNCFRQASINDGTSRRQAETGALVISSATFAVIHCNFAPWTLVMLLAGGLAAGLIYRITKSLPCCCLLHCAANLSLLLVDLSRA